MKEGFIPKDTSTEHWVPMTELQPVDYWVGFQYKGAYASRLEVNLMALEHICRRGQLPPIILRSENWTPPVATEPEMVAPGLSAFKKVDYGSQSPQRTKKQQGYMNIEPTLEGFDHMGQYVFLGWQVKFNDRKLLHDHDAAHPYATNEDREKFFVHKFNVLLKDSLQRVAYDELFHGRYLDHGYHKRELFHNMLPEVASAMLSGIVRPIIPNEFAKLLQQYVLAGVHKNVVNAMGYVAMRHVALIARDSGYKLKYKNTTTQDFAASYWRSFTFKSRYERQPDPKLTARDMALISLPGGFFMEHLYATWDACMLQKAPLVRMGKASRW